MFIKHILIFSILTFEKHPTRVTVQPSSLLPPSLGISPEAGIAVQPSAAPGIGPAAGIAVQPSAAPGIGPAARIAVQPSAAPSIGPAGKDVQPSIYRPRH
eukprot:490929-Prorocentrum_minimum.AAC.1